MIENGAPLEDRMIFMRHKSANSQQPYARPTAKREANKHLALRADGNNDLKLPAAPRQVAVVPKQVTKGAHGFQMGGGPSSLSSETVTAPSATAPPNEELSEWEEFQKFKALKAAAQCQSVAAAPALVPSSIPTAQPVMSMNVPTMANQMPMPSMMNPMSSMMNPMAMMNPMMGMGMMNPMASMMNPMMGMGMGMMNPMANPISMGIAMGMQFAQQNGNNSNTASGNNGVDITGEQALNPNNRIL